MDLWYFWGYEHGAHDHIRFAIPFALLGLLIFVAAVLLLIYFRKKRALFINKVVYVLLCFVATFFILLPLTAIASQMETICLTIPEGLKCDYTLRTEIEWGEAISLSFKTAIGSFAFQWPESLTAVIGGGDKVILIVVSVIDFGFLSYAVVESVWHGVIQGYLWRNTLRSFWRNKRNGKTHYFLFTDLPYRDIKDFLLRLKENKHAAITMVFSREDMFLEDTTFLRDQINALDIHTQIAKVGDAYFEGIFKKVKKNERIYVYSFYEDDKDNLTLAEYIRNGLRQHIEKQIKLEKDVSLADEELKQTVLKKRGSDEMQPLSKPLLDLEKRIINKERLNINKEIERIVNDLVEESEIEPSFKAKTKLDLIEKGKKKIKADFVLSEFLDKFNGIDAFISYQDPDIVDGFGDEKSCKGHVHYYSEYENVGEKFVFAHPITDFIREEALKDYQTIAVWDNAAPFGKTEAIQPKSFNAILKEVGPVHFDFIGFGRVNQAIFTEMASSYQLPGNEACYLDKEGNEIYAIDYNVYCLGDNDGTLPDLEGLKSTMPELFKGGLKLISIKGVPVDMNDRSQAKTLIDNLHVENGDIHNIIISLGDSETNMKTALYLRTLIYQKMAETEIQNRGLDEEEKKKITTDPLESHIRIYVYVKENNLYSDLSDTDIDNKKETRSIFETKDEGKAKLDKTMVPIIIFGRNGRFWNDQDHALLHIASGCKNSYDAQIKLDQDNFKIIPEWDMPQTPKDIRNLYYKFSSISPREQDENFDTALNVKSKLALLGYRLSEDPNLNGEMPLDISYCEDITRAFQPQVEITDPNKDGLPSLTVVKPLSACASAKEKEEREVLLREQKAIYRKLFVNSRSETAKMLSTLEHNRWTVRQMVTGQVSFGDTWIEKNKDLAEDKGVNRKINLSSTTIAHACIRSNDELLQMEETLFELRENNSKVAKYMQQGIFGDYKLCYWNDVGGLLYVIKLLPFVGKEEKGKIVPTFYVYNYHSSKKQ